MITHADKQAIALGAGPIPSFVPLMLPPLATNGQITKEGGSSAIDLSVQTILQTPHCPISEALLTLGASASQVKTPFNPHLVPRSAMTPFQSIDCLPFLDMYSRSSMPFDHKDLLKKFSSFHECGNAQCRTAGLKEHFHCTECYKVINRREETIRHVKWHRKRMESLQYGFMRYSSSDNCGYNHCTHNMKQTHYHCIRANCSKTYISTSDVQMHANYHRKDAVILQEGFRRFRAAEDCGSSDCPFAREHTTHFHCRRPGCSFTFKNKADMEKHKNHHLKNDAIAKDGFRKFTKSENCNFIGCKYSGLVNHIHCIRPGCDYIVHSTSQISSHKRKHERRESINFSCSVAPQNHQVLPLSCENSNGANSSTPNITASTTTATTSATTTPKPSPPQSVSPISDPQDLSSTAKLLQRASRITEICWQRFQNSVNPTPPPDGEDAQVVEQVLEAVLSSLKLFKNDPSCNNEQCSLHGTGIDHFHCFRTGCMDTVEMDPDDRVTAVEEAATISSGDMDSWREHWFMHAWQSTLSIIGFTRCSGETCNSNESEARPHLHCYFWPMCDFTMDVGAESPPRLLRHLTRHNQHFGTMMYQMKEQPTSLPSEMGGAAQRKRGRPPKHSRDIHIPRLDISPERCVDDHPNAILTMEDFLVKADMIVGGFKFYPAEGPSCVDRCCPFYITKQSHFHCVRPRCHLATSNLAVANSHRREFHAYIVIEPGYEYFDRSIDCRRPACYAKRDTAHYHCLRPRCGYSFVRVSKMRQHTEFHEGGGNAASGTGGNVFGVEKVEDPVDPYFYRTTSILPPLGMEKGGAMGDFMPFLMRILAEQVIPINKPEVTGHLLPETAESNSTESEEKMDWNETTDKEEAPAEATTAVVTNNLTAMDEGSQGPEKIETDENTAVVNEEST
ncbi:Transcription factor castor [Taenia solium]|eukprot:TsM_000853100 transcript=TsM_000853100 gene=TsM_000853100